MHLQFEFGKHGLSEKSCADVIDLLVDEMGTTHLNFDLDGSGAVDSDDVEVWLTIVGNETIGRPYLPGDVNLDGFVGVIDLDEVGIRWQTDFATSWSEGDFNGDGFIDSADLNVIGMNWQKGAAPATTIPEPPAGFILGVPGLMVLLRRRTDRCP